MATYLCYARTGKEMEVAEAMTEAGADVYVAKRMRFVRKGKQRRPEPEVQPYLPNYIFAEIPVERYIDVLATKYLAGTTYALSGPDIAALNRFRTAVDAEFSEKDKQRRNMEAISEYNPGDALHFIDGRFSDSVVRFRDMVERSHDMHPKVRATVDMMGRSVTIEIDPLAVRAAE